MIHDTSEQVIQDLRKSLAWLDLVLATLNEGVLVLDSEMKILFANDAIGNMIGKSRILLLGFFVWDVLPLYNSNAKLSKKQYSDIGHGSANPVYAIKGTPAVNNVELSMAYIPNTEHIVLVVRNVDERIEAQTQRIKLTEEKAVRRAAELSERRMLVQFKVASLLAASGNEDDTIKQILQTVCKSLGWQIGILWTLDSTSTHLRCTSWWFSKADKLDDFVAISKEDRFKKGEGLPGRVWQTGSSFWSEDFAGEIKFPRSTVAKNLDLHGSFGVPLKNRDEIIGVMEFLDERSAKPDTELLTSMTTIGIQIAQYMERKNIERALELERQRLYNFLSQSPAAIAVIAEPTHIYEFANPFYQKIFNRREKDLLGKTIREVYPEVASQGIYEIFDNVFHTGEPFAVAEYPATFNRTGKEAAEQGFFNFVAQPIRDGAGKVDRILIHAIEVTEQVQARQKVEQSEKEVIKVNEKLEERVLQRTKELTMTNKELERSNDALADFAYVASHDLQEPLRKIIAFSSLLATDHKDSLPPEAHEYINALQRSTARMSTLLTDLLTYSRVTTQAQPFQQVELSRIVEDVMDDLQQRIEDTRAEIKIGNLDTIIADNLQMRLLLQNLVSNALKYVKKGVPPKVKISTKTADGFCTICVADNGIGFNEIYLDRIFTIFQRLHGKSEYQGTGIGLAICKKIVDRHGGKITAKSRVDEGSTFIVTLPQKLG